MRIRMRETKRGAEDGYTLKDYLAGGEYDLTRTLGARDLAAVFVREGWAEQIDAASSAVKGQPVDADDPRPLYRLPLEAEYRAAGYSGDYAAMIASETARALLDGFRVEVRARLPGDEKLEAAAAEFIEKAASLKDEQRRLAEDPGTKPSPELTEADVQTLVDREPAARGQFAPAAAAAPAGALPAVEAPPPPAPVEEAPPAPAAPTPSSKKKKR